MARDTLWIMAAHILTAYEITDPVDMEGRKLTAESRLEYTNAMVRYVYQFFPLVHSLKGLSLT